MKRCPQCDRTYTDDAMSFCLDDGSPLTKSNPTVDLGATIAYIPRQTDKPSPPVQPTPPSQPPPPSHPSQPTIAYRPGQMPPPIPPSTPTWRPPVPGPSYPPPQPQKRSAWPWVLGIGAILLLMGLGLIALIFAIARISNTNNNNRASTTNANNNNSRSSRNSNSNNSNANSNTNASLPSFFSDDFSSPNWGVGPSKFGRTWYQSDEYHMNATKGGYIVMYAPKTGQYETENATIKITARNVDGTETSKGFGILVHGELKNDQLEDYGFLIDTGTKGYYRVIEHKGGAETQLVSWTSSAAIRTGTTPNQLEIRIRDLKMDFYINGQFVTSVNDAEGYRRGKVGLYTSDATEVAFDDLEISR
jgi:cytoskeletal protein RodZ